MDSEKESEDTPEARNYQIKIMEIAIRQNTIIYLPTGSGKTFIAVMILKHLAGQDIDKSFAEGGKLCIMLVNAVTLVNQQANYLRRFTPFNVGSYSGDMNIDSWNRSHWAEEFNKNKVLVMTSQILVNLVDSSFLTLGSVSLLIFDECHHAVNDQPMRILMLNFSNLANPPRVVGLTATLLNRNIIPSQVEMEIKNLETTFHSKIAATDELQSVLNYSTNPTERVKIFNSHTQTPLEIETCDTLEKLLLVLGKVKIDTKTTPAPAPHFKLLKSESVLKDISKIIKDTIVHLQSFGIFGGQLAIVAHIIQLERIKKSCQDTKYAVVLEAALTTFLCLQRKLKSEMHSYSKVDRIHKFSSDQVLKLFETLREYKELKKEMCGIVFVHRRFTAKVLYNVLLELSKHDPEFNDLRPNFVVGFNVNPHNDVREGLYNNKKQKKIIMEFQNKEINLLVSSNILEEGIDIPLCSYVTKFDKPLHYCSYVQSKGRARHKDSLYYLLVESKDAEKFCINYRTYRKVEETLTECLIGKNDLREGPKDEDLEEFYKEHILPPYYVDGPNSAKVTLLSAIALLCRYCLSLPCDKYTDYSPNWFTNEKNKPTDFQVIIELPLICPISEIIIGPIMPNLKLAKRAAALKTCELLHKLGELDDKLLPKKRSDVSEDLSCFFQHWPKHEKEAGTIKKRRIHDIKIPQVIRGEIKANKLLHLHVIELQPKFSSSMVESISQEVLYNMYTSQLCFGVLSCNKLPKLCSFSVYVSLGDITVDFKVNQKTLTLTEEEIDRIKIFHFLVFNDVLKLVKPFLIFDNTAEEGLLLVPLQKDQVAIDFELLRDKRKMVSKIDEPSHAERVQLEVYEDNYLGAIVSPWYRHDEKNYLVSSVCTQFNAHSAFPAPEFDTYANYFKEKYHATVVNSEQPLLLVKSLSKRLNCLKPRGTGGKRSRDKIYEDFEEHLIPELCVKHNFPGSLWVQANLLPSILHRLIFLLQADELRTQIAQDSGMGITTLNPDTSWKSLIADIHLMKDEVKKSSKSKPLNNLDELEVVVELPNIAMKQLKQDFASKSLELEFPWQESDEPIDIERNLNVTLMDIQYYENFISQKITIDEHRKRSSPTKKNNFLAITFDKNYIERKISLLDTIENNHGPELSEIYQSLATLKCNDVVNLERLETLGDSFLKVACSLFIMLNYPNYDEGKATSFKGKLISNKNLYYIGVNKNIPGYIKAADFTPSYEWKPPYFRVPQCITNHINNNEISSAAMLKISLPYDAQISGLLNCELEEEISHYKNLPTEENNDHNLDSMLTFINKKVVSDKTVADTVEALIGVYFKSYGFVGCLKFLKWLELIPESRNIEQLLEMVPPNPILNNKDAIKKINYHIPAPTYEEIEKILGYKFKNRAYLLQALTHASYSTNRVTNCYQRLEFLGDSVLDFLITCYIYETSQDLSPGELTDLRSALVNNITFAAFTVKCGFHKFLLFSNNKLLEYISNFVEFQEARDFVINDDVLILLEENELALADHIDVPKVLGDVFEALAGAVFLDSGMDFKQVWSVFYRIMWKEIEMFRSNTPKNSVRLLFETVGAHPVFHKAVNMDNGRTMISLDFMLLGAKKRVYGFGENKVLAKKAAAKIALRFLSN